MRLDGTQPHEQLEQEWANFNGLDPAGMVACSSGTAALHLLWECSGIEQQYSRENRQEVICPNLTMVAVPRAVAMAGLEPIFVDCYGDTLNMEPGLVEDIIIWKTRGLCVVHTYGRVAAMDKLIDLANRYDLFLAEDLSEAHGIKPHPSTDAAAWSFYKNKVIAGEEGGCVWFRDKEAAAWARQLRSQGFTDAHDFNHIPRGCNYRLASTLASCVLHSLNKYQNYNVLSKRQMVETAYDRDCPAQWKMPKRDVPWVYDFRIQGLTYGLQNRIVEVLNGQGIAARHCFKPMTNQPEFKGCRSISRGVAAVRSREVMYLPIQPGMMIPEGVFTTIAELVQDSPAALPASALATLTQAQRTLGGTVSTPTPDNRPV